MKMGVIQLWWHGRCAPLLCGAFIAAFIALPLAAQSTAQDQRIAQESTVPAPATGALPSNAEILKELEQMRARIAELEAQLKAQQGRESAAMDAAARASAAVLNAPNSTQAGKQPSKQQEMPSTPFAYADWTWLNGTPRNKDAVWDSKFFTPEVRFDTHFVHSFNNPRDDSMGGSTEVFRSNEFQIEQFWRRLPLAECPRPRFDHEWNVWSDNAAQ